MSKARCAATPDDDGWRIELIGRPGRLFAKDRVLPLTDWPVVARGHPGAALLLSLLDTEDAQRDGDGVRLSHATVADLSPADIDLEPGDDTAPFLPTLYGDRPVDPVTAEQEERDPVREPLLPSQQAEQFQARFLAQGSRRHFTLGGGVYTVLDAPVAAALDVVARVNRADAETRHAFRNDPQSFLIPAIEAAGGEGDVICDLRAYGERVIGVGDWIPPKLSFPLAVSRQWFPDEEIEIFTITIPDEQPLEVRAEEIPALQERIARSQSAGLPTCEFNGRSLPLNEDLVTTIQGLVGRIQPPAATDRPVKEQPERQPRQAAITQDNEEWLTFLAERRSQRRQTPVFLPTDLRKRTPPKPHQESGITWLQAAYLAGAPGVLLADDMGLGKTYQVLAFLRWLQATHRTRRQPVLVVAPKTLLGNWTDEIEQHLGPSALGRERRIFGQGVSTLKLGQLRGNDTNLGRQTLDIEPIQSADFVLTTYETLRDYHLSFGKIPFAVVVYDEAQKLKNPTSLMNRGAKAQQGQFVLMMTGTPIENSVLDLWTLLDIAWPGFLGLSAKEFLKRYGNDDPAAREALKQRLIEPTPVPDSEVPVPPVMLRRFKQDILEGLPARTVETPRAPMPAEQRMAYDAVLAAIRDQGLRALEALQRLRAVSLHPHLGQRPTSAQEDSAFIAASARFTLLFQILDQIRERREKSLIFVELRDAQRALYELIQRRYDLASPQPEIINGATTTPARDRIRHSFQKRRGFDVLILGPKAAGFGLTLTSANHVIHLNRWWNPAVED